LDTKEEGMMERRDARATTRIMHFISWKFGAGPIPPSKSREDLQQVHRLRGESRSTMEH
jgi:hypothetical protein